MKPKQKVIFVPKQSLTIYNNKEKIRATAIKKPAGHNRKWAGILFGEMLLIPFFSYRLFALVVPIEIMVLFGIYCLGILYTLYQLIGHFRYKYAATDERIIFTPNKILTADSRNRAIESPYFFELFIKMKKGITEIKVMNFQREIIEFELLDIQDLVYFTDGLSKLYEVEFFHAQQINSRTEKVIFLSKNGFHYNKLILIREEKNLQFKFFDYPQKELIFDWNKKLLFINNLTTNKEEEIAIDEIETIKVILSKTYNTKQSKLYINTFAVKISLRSRKVLNIAFFDLEDNLMTLSVFKTATNFIKTLQKQALLNHVKLELEAF